MQNELCYLPPKGRKWKMPCTILAVWFNLHQTKFYVKVWLSSRNLRTWLLSLFKIPALVVAILKEKMRAGILTPVLGFFVGATEDPWKTNCRMYFYVTEELLQIINAIFQWTSKGCLFLDTPWGTLCFEES